MMTHNKNKLYATASWRDSALVARRISRHDMLDSRTYWGYPWTSRLLHR